MYILILCSSLYLWQWIVEQKLIVCCVLCCRWVRWQWRNVWRLSLSLNLRRKAENWLSLALMVSCLFSCFWHWYTVYHILVYELWACISVLTGDCRVLFCLVIALWCVVLLSAAVCVCIYTVSPIKHANFFVWVCTIFDAVSSKCANFDEVQFLTKYINIWHS